MVPNAPESVLQSTFNYHTSSEVSNPGPDAHSLEPHTLALWKSQQSSSSVQQAKNAENTETDNALPWPIHSLAYHEFLKVKQLCEESPFVFMRKDNLLLYYKLKYDLGFSLITTSQAYQYLPSTRVFIYNNIHFIYFTWKFNELQRFPPSSLLNRLRYLTFPATYPISMLKAMYNALYENHLSNKEFYQLCCQAFGKPQTNPSKDSSGVPKFVIPNESFKDSMTFSEFIASSVTSITSHPKKSSSDFIALESSSTSGNLSNVQYSSSDSETVYSSESDSDSSYSPPRKNIGKRSSSSLSFTFSTSNHSKKQRYPFSGTYRKEHFSRFEHEPPYPSRYFHTAMGISASSLSTSFHLGSSPPLPPPLPSTFLSTQCSITTRELLFYLKEMFLSSMRDGYMDSQHPSDKDKSVNVDPVDKMGKDLSKIIVVSSHFASPTIHASHFF